MKKIIIIISFILLPSICLGAGTPYENQQSCPTDGLLGFNCTGTQNFPDDGYGRIPVIDNIAPDPSYSISNDRTLLNGWSPDYNMVSGDVYYYDSGSGSFLTIIYALPVSNQKAFQLSAPDYSDGSYVLSTTLVGNLGVPNLSFSASKPFQVFQGKFYFDVSEIPNNATTTTDGVKYGDWIFVNSIMIFFMSFFPISVIFGLLRKRR